MTALDEQPAAVPDCDHHWIGHLRGGEPLSVRICSFCGDPDWDDLRSQLDEREHPRKGPGGCHAALIIAGGHFWCDLTAPHGGWPHSSTAAESMERQAEAVAYGLFVLDAPIGWDHPRRYAALPEQDRELLLARARFVLAYAGDYAEIEAVS